MLIFHGVILHRHLGVKNQLLMLVLGSDYEIDKKKGRARILYGAFLAIYNFFRIVFFPNGIECVFDKASH